MTEFINFCGDIINTSSIKTITARAGKTYLIDKDNYEIYNVDSLPYKIKNFFNRIMGKKIHSDNIIQEYHYNIVITLNDGRKCICDFPNQKMRDEAYKGIKEKLNIIYSI